MDNLYLRKSNRTQRVDAPVHNSVELCLLRAIFGITDDGDEQALAAEGVVYEGETYAPKELAADMGVSVFSVYKMFDEQRPLRFGSVLKILDFMRFKNPNDRRLIDFVCKYAGVVAMPEGLNSGLVRDIAELAAKIRKEG